MAGPCPSSPENPSEWKSTEPGNRTGKSDEGLKDDLSKIHGIGPVFARTLNKMGLSIPLCQIARWKPEDIDKVAKKLYTAPDRIKRDKWIDEAKKLHAEQKYGQRLLSHAHLFMKLLLQGRRSPASAGDGEPAHFIPRIIPGLPIAAAHARRQPLPEWPFWTVPSEILLKLLRGLSQLPGKPK